METLLLIFQVILTICIVIVVLLQKSSSIGLGAYSGSNESLFGAKGPANFMAKITMCLAVAFLANTIGLVYVYNTKSTKSIVDNVEIPKNVPLPLPSNVNSFPLSSPLMDNQQNNDSVMQPKLQLMPQGLTGGINNSINNNVEGNTQENNVKNDNLDSKENENK